MKIKVLMENTPYRTDAAAEHGLSLYMETGKHRLLFDMGPSDGFARNAQLLHVDLSSVDGAILSHGHYDHGGGLGCFLGLNHKAPVYMSSFAFEPHYNAAGNSIGLDAALRDNPQFVMVPDYLRIDDELELFSCNDLPRPFGTDTAGLLMACGAEKVPEDFRHEQYLLIHDGDRRILISGCSHKGVLNLVDWFHPDVLIGGFHFMKLDPAGEGRRMLRQAADQLATSPTTYYTCHCTGLEPYSFLKASMGEKLGYLASGQEIEL